MPPAGTPTVFQFNLFFDLTKDQHNNQSIDMLKSTGIDFSKLRSEMAIPQFLFASQLMATGLMCNSNVVWITFDGAADFGYLL